MLPHNLFVPGLVTVILASFNHDKFISEAIHSVFEQTYQDIEFIIIDDCSTDDTAHVAQQIANAPSFRRRFRGLSVDVNPRNSGAHSTFNTGIRKASGEFITFFNSDDLFEKNRLEAMVSRCSSPEEPFLAFSAVKLFSMEPNATIPRELIEILERGPPVFQKELPSLSTAFLRYQITGSSGNILLNNVLMRRLGGFAAFKYCHDWDFMLRAISLAEPIFVTETSYLYRMHLLNSFRNLQDLAVEESAAVLKLFFQRIVNGQIENPKCPTPANWPWIFEMISKRFETYDAWVEENCYQTRYAARQAAYTRELAVGIL